MIVDRYAGEHSSTCAPAVHAFEAAVAAVAAHRPTAGVALAKALAADPGLVAGHALKGFAGLILGRREPWLAARADRDAARKAIDEQGGSDGERALVEALELASDGRILAAADRLDRRLHEAPHDFLAIKLSHSLRFLGGDRQGMMRTLNGVLPAWSAASSGYGYVLGCHAFALEEHKRFRDAERIGRRAIEHAPDDAWAIHAVGHVLEMNGRTRDGIDWFERSRPVWSECNNFAFHMAWHLALFHLEQNNPERVLALYDHHIRAMPTDDFRDVANAASLLWRLRQERVPVGDRWAELAEIARRRAEDTTLVFASLHYLLALVASGDLADAQHLVMALAEKALAQDGDQAGVARDVGVDLGQAILSLATRRRSRVAFADILRRLPALGGSGAQRDVFLRTLADIAAEAGDERATLVILAARARTQSHDRFARNVLARLDGSRMHARRVA